MVPPFDYPFAIPTFLNREKNENMSNIIVSPIVMLVRNRMNAAMPVQQECRHFIESYFHIDV